MTVCPKCGYARGAAETAPVWQCPSCGIAYNKFRKEGEARDAAPSDAGGDLRMQGPWAGSTDRSGAVAMGAYGGVLLTFHTLQVMYGSWRTFEWLPAAIAVCAFLFWLSAYRRLKVVDDTPTSTVAAAAQGYVELHGTVVPAEGNALAGHLTRAPCVWYRCHYLKGKEQHTEERGAVFILRDDTGDCVIDPADAEVICDRCQEAPGMEWSIRPGDAIYAIGHFSSGGAAAQRHVALQAAYAVNSKQGDADWLARHDANGDGALDRGEEAAARDAVRRDLERNYAQQGGMHALGRSPDDKPFLVIAANHDAVVSRYRRLTMLHLAVFFGALGAWAWLWRM